VYNYLMSASEWHPSKDTMPVSRYYPKDARFQFVNGVAPPELLSLPALLMPEVNEFVEQTAHVATIHSAKIKGNDISIEYTIDKSIPVLSVSKLVKLADELEIPTGGFMLNHTHWDVHNVDLFRVLLTNNAVKVPEPTLFKLDTARNRKLISVMMPFNAGFNGVYEAIKKAATANSYQCNRADDIWLHHQVMQTIVSLISRSGIIIADCTGKNPNVFYEAGIAHTLGRDVILIAQNINDVPFDLRHLAILLYYPNQQGLDDLTAKLTVRINDVAAIQTWD
jgi:hypothetical protein